MTIPPLETLLPHRKPMLLLDRVLILGEKEIVADKQIQADDFFLQGHYPDYPIVPGVITCECIFQAGAALLSQYLGPTDLVPVVARIGNAKFRLTIRPGDHVLYRVQLLERLGSVFLMKGEARVNDRVAATVEFSCALAPRQP